MLSGKIKVSVDEMSKAHPSPHGMGSSVQEGHTESEVVNDVEKSGFQTQRGSTHMNSEILTALTRPTHT